MTNYYDLVLGIIPLALIGITGGLYLAGLSLTTAVPAGAGVSAAVICHAMFVRAPVDRVVAREPDPEPEYSAGGSFPQAD